MYQPIHERVYRRDKQQGTLSKRHVDAYQHSFFMGA